MTVKGPRNPTQPRAGSVTVRMYDVGFGDCFLVSLPSPEGTKRVLFDCGSIKAGARPMKDVVDQVIADVTRDGGPPRIEVVVATHRHRDHVSGFDNAAWRNVEVGEVWMPWTEDPTDPDAKRIRNVQSRLAFAIDKAAGVRLSAAATLDERARAEQIRQLALNAMSNEGAMRTLHHGFRGAPVRRFLPRSDARRSWFQTHLLPGVTIHVLGPSRDEDVIRDMDPPAGQSYLRLADSVDEYESGPVNPFGRDWWVEADRYEGEYGGLAATLPASDRDRIADLGSGMEGMAAAALDKAVNGTSLMLVLQVNGATLLFPGDAQWGTWRQALDNAEFRQLLAETDFYKVGHHGSHNATPVDFVEDVLGTRFQAMASVTGMSQWPRIPKQELVERLAEKSRGKVARSDRPADAERHFTVSGDGYIDAVIRT